MKGMENLLKIAGSKLGMSPESLKSALEKGDMSTVMTNMKPGDKEKLKSVLENGSAMQEIMKNPQAAQMMKNMNKK